MSAIVSYLIILAVVSLSEVMSFDICVDEFWEKFKEQNCKVYHNKDEETFRKAIWDKHVKTAMRNDLAYDMGLSSYRMGINEFFDMSVEEVVQKMTGFRYDGVPDRRSGGRSPRQANNDSLPGSIDWRERGYVTEIMNQGQCGSCYAFSACGSLEGQYRNRTGNLVTLSKQNLVDCSETTGNDGCGGGLMTRSFEWVIRNDGIDLERNYPYEEAERRCRYERGGSGVRVARYVELEAGNERALQRAVATVGPVSVGIIANLESFQHYKEGIYDDPRCTRRRMDHAVVAVGYGTEDGKDYWILKNSCGTTWGEKGFMRLARNRNNMCNVATAASYPILS